LFSYYDYILLVIILPKILLKDLMLLKTVVLIF
jgi:hypothetical protein